MLVAFFEDEATTYEFDDYAGPVSFVPAKHDVTKPLPVVICATDSGDRGRAKSWNTSGSIIVKTPVMSDQGVLMAEESNELEFAVLKALENYVPDDDRPQPLCAAINAVAAAEGYDNFMLTNFQISSIENSEDEDCWVFTINFKASVLNDSNN